MKYDKIFWLEDNPTFLSWLVEDSDSGLNIKNLLKRVTFAYDYEMGKDIIGKEDFDLCILDGDFPLKLDEKRRKYIDDFLVATPLEGYKFKWADNYEDNMEYNHFLKFYKECLSPKQKVVVYSMSKEACYHAFKIGLPFYFKREKAEEVPKNLKIFRHNSLDVTDPVKISNWEYGGPKELVERYLID
jgi:hypothetical protein